jgi:hypothetical protein
VDALASIQGAPVLFFYCRQKEERKRTFVDILRELLAQILSIDLALAALLSETYSTYDQRRFVSTSVVKEAADVAFSSQRVSYVVLDGLDECDASEADKVLSWLISRQRQAPLGNDGHVRLLCLGQRTDLLQTALCSGLDISLDTQQRHKDDIERYVQQRMQDISDTLSLEASIQDSIVAKISDVANGSLSCLFHTPSLLWHTDIHYYRHVPLRQGGFGQSCRPIYTRGIDEGT